MSVYVDKAENALGRMKMCHMIADTPLELMQMARALNLDFSWFQRDASVPHFDISKGKRKAAVKAGAVELERREFVEVMQRVRASWPRTSGGKWML